MAERAVEAIRRAAPRMAIAARAHDLDRGARLKKAGATAVVPETLEASLQLASLVLRNAGLDAETIDQSLKSVRDRGYDALREPADTAT